LLLITLCMIVKNEEANLDGCLQAIACYMDEIIIVDTGSSDRTKEIALQYTPNVFDYEWNNNFAEARNFSISKASNEFILVIDSDEMVVNINIDEIKRLMEHNKKRIGRLLRLNEYTRDEAHFQYKERVNRLFSKKCYRYQGIIHEQLVRSHDNEKDSIDRTDNIDITDSIDSSDNIDITDSNNSIDTTNITITSDTTHITNTADTADTADNTYLLPLTIKHSGYEGNVVERSKKTDRNISLLKKALESTPDDPYLIYQLGKSYYMQEDYEIAAQYFGDALFYDLDPRLEYVQDMVESYGYSLINSGQYENALQLLNIYDEFAVNADFVFLVALIYMHNTMFEEAVQEFQNATTIQESKMDGVNSYRAYYNIGVIYECLGMFDQANKYYILCEDFAPAQNQLDKVRRGLLDIDTSDL